MYSSQGGGRPRGRAVHLVPESIAKGMRLGVTEDDPNGMGEGLLPIGNAPQPGGPDQPTAWIPPKEPTISVPTWINLPNSRIKLLNRIAIGLHFVMAIVAIIGRWV
jgi:hypothetical protein